MTTSLPRTRLEWPRGPAPKEAIDTEWLLANGIGGYAFGTLAACNTRRYHGYFTPALPGHGRVVLLARLGETLEVDGERYRLDGEEQDSVGPVVPGVKWLRAFELIGLLPRWEYACGEARLTRELTWVHGQNTLVLRYTFEGHAPAKLQLRPWPVFRMHDRPLASHAPSPRLSADGDGWRFALADDAPPMWLSLQSPQRARFIEAPERSRVQHYRVEQRRGYEHQETQESPGHFDCELAPGESLTFALTTEGPDALRGSSQDAFAHERARQLALLERAPPEAKTGVGARLVLAADSYIIDPVSRSKRASESEAGTQGARSVIAGYPWFTDWGRDTMISLEGLTLCTGREEEAAEILRTFRLAVRDGLLPNLYPEGAQDGLYHTADATLWFFHAIDRYVSHTKDEALLQEFWPTLEEIVAHHQRGTRYGIRVDPEDGLLTQGEEGYQLTWMDAKVDGWVVTPRRGKAVELNALWFNALSLMRDWAERLGRDPSPFAAPADRLKKAFNHRFWNETSGCLFDVVDVEGVRGATDPAIRPNQVFAIGLRHPVLAPERWAQVMARVDELLLTPVGLRSLAPGSADYRSHYDGNLRTRDGAYHQGTVWGWLIGPYVSARLKLDADPARARAALQGLIDHLEDGCIGQAAEIFDASEPFAPRGCVAQAWSIAELLRAWLAVRAA